MSGDGDVTVKCEDGSEFRGDVVIGADGIHSRRGKRCKNMQRNKPTWLNGQG